MGGSSAKQIGKSENLSDEQQKAFSELFAGFNPGGLASQIASPENAGNFFDQIVGDPSRKQFSEDILPQIQEQFAGATSGSGFNRALTRSASDFEGQLSAQKAGFQQDAQNQQLQALMSLLGLNAASPIIQQATPGFGAQLGAGIGKGVGQAIGGINPTDIFSFFKKPQQ